MSVLDHFRLDGKRALITGGSRGLGRAIAQAFAEAGADLVLVGRDRDSLDTAARELQALRRRIDLVSADLHSAEAAEQMCAQVLEQVGSIDVFVNNVGGRREDISTESMTLAAWRGFLDLNLTIDQVGTYAVLDTSYDSRTTSGIVNAGTIDAGLSGGTFTIQGSGSFTNQGTIAVSNGDTVSLDSSSWSNSGPTHVELTLTFGPPNQNKDEKPAKLVFQSWGTLVHQLGFEFRDIPLP